MSLQRICAIAVIAFLSGFQNCSVYSARFSDLPSNGVSEMFSQLKPAFAVRGSGCVTCHADVRSSFITDFGHGDPWFAAHTVPTQLKFAGGSMYGDHENSWATSKIAGPIYVPKTESFTADAFSGTLSQYLETQEAKKVAAERSAVLEKEKIFIGAPSASRLRARFRVTPGQPTLFLPSEKNSPPFFGMILQPEGFYQNVGTLDCDGDLFVDGTVFLSNVRIRTKNGCRIYSTGSIFVHGPIEYTDLVTDSVSNVNLQLSSSRAVVLGVGLAHCETAANPGSYSTDPLTFGFSPLEYRFKGLWTIPGHFTRSGAAQGMNPAAENGMILEEGKKLLGMMDASCFPGGRDVDLNHLVVNAPQVHSRYRGKFKGVVIAETALMSPSKLSFEFDPVFERVEVLPMLRRSDFLVVE